MSESGSPIYRHVRQKPFEPAAGDPEAIEAIERHIDQHLGQPETVLHEIVSDLVHIDVHIVPPQPGRPFTMLVTTGMSDRAMSVPAGHEDLAYLELLLALPPTWQLNEKIAPFKEERNYWPIRLLKMLARLPHEYDTWLGLYHTMPNGDPPAPFDASTKLSGAIITIPKLVPESFATVPVRPGKKIWFLAVTPTYPEELEFKQKRGAAALQARFDKAGVSELIDPQRRNVCRKRFLGLF